MEKPPRIVVHCPETLVVKFGEDNGCVYRLCLIPKNLCHFVVAPFTDNHRDARFDDSRFFGGDLGQCVAQILHVVVSDVGDDAEVGGDDVGAVEPASKTHFNDCHVGCLLGKVEEGHFHGQLEERGLQGFKTALVLFHEIHDELPAYHFPVYAYPFAEIDQVRGGIQARFIAGLLQDGSQEVRRGSLAVGSSHVDGFEAAVGMVEELVQSEAIVEPGFVGLVADLLVVGHLAVKICEDFVVSHSWYGDGLTSRWGSCG